MAIQQSRSYSEDTDRRYAAPLKDRLTEQQLNSLHTELQTFLKGKVIQVDEWLKSRGALNKYGGVIVSNYKPTIYNEGRVKQHVDCDPILYEQLKADYEQYTNWMGKKQYAERQKLTQYQEIANSL